jgi:hypothetical protein
MSGRPRQRHHIREGGETLRAEEGDETVEELADEAAKTKNELKQSTETGKKVQEESQDSSHQHEV